MMVNCDVLWYDVDKRPISSMMVNWALGPWDCAVSTELDGMSLRTVGRLPCLGVGTGKSRPVIAKDSTV
jgi:hypothetical protein